MKKLAFAFAGAAALTLAACNGNNEDAMENGQMNQPTDLNDMMDVNATANMEAEALGTQQQQLEEENASAPADNTSNPQDEDEQNVSGM